jgi:hypothetical protein
MEDVCSKLSAMILLYVSKESLDAAKKEPMWTMIEDAVDAEGLWKLVDKGTRYTQQEK